MGVKRKPIDWDDVLPAILAGVPCYKVAARVGVTPKTLSARLRADLPPGKAGIVIAQIHRLAADRSRACVDWAKFERLVDHGFTIAEINSYFGYSRTSHALTRKRHRLPEHMQQRLKDKIRANRYKRHPLAPCGTTAAYTRHIRARQRPDPACSAAHAAVIRTRRAAAP
jgi:hypothetical protein